MQSLLNLYKKHKDIIPYAFWGVAATVVNIVLFGSINQFTSINYSVNYCFSWFVTVLFAFYTNKYFVFHTKHYSYKEFWYQMVTFFAGRLITGIVGLGILSFGVSVLGFNTKLGKNIFNIIQNVVVVILNYFWAIFISFKEKEHK
ncbi:GtrA family protein [Fructilactobacillus sp. Tb1]|uniref:GtrA family protein n=1 Tax=Fructilactobacillus sp. Tb1 TaxID=3422304 RepID=UPI003D278BA0